MNTKEIRDFLTQGEVVFNLESKRSGDSYKYRIRKVPENKFTNKYFYFVSVFADGKYLYLGMLTFYFAKALFFLKTTDKSRFSPDHKSYKALDWFLKTLNQEKDISDLVAFKPVSSRKI